MWLVVVDDKVLILEVVNVRDLSLDLQLGERPGRALQLWGVQWERGRKLMKNFKTCFRLFKQKRPEYTAHVYIIESEASLLYSCTNGARCLYVFIWCTFWPPGGPALHANVAGQIGIESV